MQTQYSGKFSKVSRQRHLQETAFQLPVNAYPAESRQSDPAGKASPDQRNPNTNLVPRVFGLATKACLNLDKVREIFVLSSVNGNPNV